MWLWFPGITTIEIHHIVHFKWIPFITHILHLNTVDFLTKYLKREYSGKTKEVRVKVMKGRWESGCACIDD